MKFNSQMMKPITALTLVFLIIFVTRRHAGGLLSIVHYPNDLKNLLNQNPDKLLGGLLLDGLDESSCQSRYQSNLYHRTRPRQPSSYLISKLRNYEALQKRCGTNTDAYNKTVEILKSNGEYSNNTTDCKYMIWTPFEGLGNRMISLASTFLYSLLTNRVLLIGEGDTMPDLFCEPFPDVSWLLPSDFPVGQFKFSKHSPNSYGKLSKNHTINMMPPYVYIYMVAYIGGSPNGPVEQLSFCDQGQKLLHDVPFLILKSNMYFAPSLFSIPSFQQELENLFPEKETVFHHLGRYLFHPSNSVWGLITMYYDSYLAKADEKLGLQIRVLNGNQSAFPNMKMILSCTMNENLLPMTNNTQVSTVEEAPNSKTKVVLVTSLVPSFYEQLRKMYWKKATITGEKIGVYQPSHEEKQQTGNLMHDEKALAEINLLSMCDKLVTTGRSTFGYVAQSLGGLRPWIIYSEPTKRHNLSCKKAFSIEPCGLCSTLIYQCSNETATLPPHSRRCEDGYPNQRTMKLLDDNV